MGTATQISLDTYLTTSYEPDVDYVDGVLEERTRQALRGIKSMLAKDVRQMAVVSGH